MSSVEHILTECIEEVRSGKATPAECLQRYPSVRGELEPLLALAASIPSSSSLGYETGYSLSAKAALLNRIGTIRQQRRWSIADFLSFGISPRYAFARVAVAVVTLVIMVSMAVGGVTYAAQSSVPGDLLYPVKISAENVRVLAAGSYAAKAELNLAFAQQRLDEIGKLADTDATRTQSAVNGYRDKLEAAEQQIESIANPSTYSDTLISALQALHAQMSACDGLVDTVPAPALGIEEAGALAVSYQLTLLDRLAGQDIAQATRMNLELMNDRLLRARSQAEAGHYQFMSEVLLQYQEFNRFGEALLQRSRAGEGQPLETDNLIVQGTTEYLGVLSDLSGRVPQQYQAVVELSRQATMGYQAEVRQGNSGPGNSIGPGQSGPGPGNDVTPGNSDNGTEKNPAMGPDNSGIPGSVDTNPASGSSGTDATIPADDTSPADSAGPSAGEGGSGNGTITRPGDGNAGTGEATGPSDSSQDPSGGTGSGSGPTDPQQGPPDGAGSENGPSNQPPGPSNGAK